MLSQPVKTTRHKLHAPFLLPLMGTLAGIILTHLGFISILNAFLITCGALALFIIIILYAVHLYLAMQLLLVLSFIGLSSLQYALQKKYHDLVILNYSEQTFDAQGLVTDKELLVDQRFRERLKIQIRQICHTKKSEHSSHADFSISCYVPFYSKIDIDDIVLLQSFTIKESKKVSLAQNQSFFDYLIKENMAASIFIDKKITLLKRESPVYSYKRWLWHKRQKLLRIFKQKLSRYSFDYFSLIFLGHKQICNRNELSTTFNYWGISHYLARSGLHIILFVLIWQFFLNFLPIAMILKSLILLCICLLYALLSWSSLSFYRAFFIFLLTQAGKLTHQQINYIHLTSFLALAFLLFNPMNLFFLDFQLSFGLTGILILISWINQTNKKPTIESPKQAARV
jgi:competence protein ComEC